MTICCCNLFLSAAVIRYNQQGAELHCLKTAWTERVPEQGHDGWSYRPLQSLLTYSIRHIDFNNHLLFWLWLIKLNQMIDQHNMKYCTFAQMLSCEGPFQGSDDIIHGKVQEVLYSNHSFLSPSMMSVCLFVSYLVAAHVKSHTERFLSTYTHSEWDISLPTCTLRHAVE